MRLFLPVLAGLVLLAVTFVAAPAIAGPLMQSKYDELKRSCGKEASANWTGCNSDDISSLNARRDIADVFWGWGAAVAATTGVLFFVEGRRGTVSPPAGGSTGLLATVRC